MAQMDLEGAVTVMILILGILGVILNGITLGVILGNIEITPQYMLIINLLLADMFMSLSRVAWGVGFILETYMNQYFRLLSSFVYPAVITCFSMSLTACQHYILIVYPLHAPRHVTKRNTMCAIILSWVFALVPDIVFSMLGSYLAYDGGKWSSDISLMIEATLGDLWQFAYLPVMYVTTILFIFSYGRIFWERSKSLKKNPEHRSGEQRHSLNTSLLIVGTFLASYLPFCVFATVIRFNVIESFNNSSYLFIRALRNFNNICDPFIFAIRLKLVKQAFKRCCWGWNTSPQYSASQNIEMQ